MTVLEYFNLYQEAAEGNDETLIALYNMAKDGGDVSAMGIVGCLFFLNKRINADKDVMVPFVQKSLDADNPFGCYCYACMLADGIEVEKDRQKAKKEMLYAAKAGIPRAMYILGLLHYWDQEFDDSYKWLYKAYKNGNTEGEFILGQHYNNGWGCIMDKKAALEHFNNAAARDKDAVAMIAVYHYFGEAGLPKDIQKAIMYASAYAELSGDKELMDLSKAQDYGCWLLLLGKVFQRVRINEDTLYNVFSEAEKRGNQEAAAIAAELRPRVMEAREKANLKEQIDDVKDQWQDVLEDIIKGGLGIED